MISLSFFGHLDGVEYEQHVSKLKTLSAAILACGLSEFSERLQKENEGSKLSAPPKILFFSARAIRFRFLP
jgi:hypothetical protein